MSRFSSCLTRTTKMAYIMLPLCLLFTLSYAAHVHAAVCIDNSSISCTTIPNPVLSSATTIPAGRHILLAVNTDPAAAVTVNNTMGSTFTLLGSSTPAAVE
jgi:hypothetical protein